jgi:hypothetical protein
MEGGRGRGGLVGGRERGVDKERYFMLKKCVCILFVNNACTFLKHTSVILISILF